MPSLKSNKNLLGLPQNKEPLGTRCLTVFVPDDPEWIGLFLGALWRLSQQVWYDRDTSHSAKTVADRWKAVYNDLLTRMRTGNPCEVVDMFDIRLNPADPCELQKTFDGSTWVHGAWLDECFKNTIKRNPKTGELGYYDGIDFFRFPEGEWVDNPPDIVFPEPRETGGLDSDLCIASASAARVLQQLYRETWDWFNTSLTLGAIDLAQSMVAWSEVIMQGVSSLYDMVSHAEELYLESAAYVDGGFPDSELEAVQNILYCRATFDADNRVLFNFNGVISDFGAMSGSPYSGLNFLLQLYLGESGLNAAGNIIAVSSADCGAASCAVWCYTFPFSVDDGGFTLWGGLPGVTPTRGQYIGGANGWSWADVVTTATNRLERGLAVERTFDVSSITEVSIMFNGTMGKFDAGGGQPGITVWLSDGISDTLVIDAPYSAALNGTNLILTNNGTWDGKNRVMVYMRCSSDGSPPRTVNGNINLASVTLRGTGSNPFGEDNC